MDELILRVDESIARDRLIDDGDRILVAVSGGLDSMVLLHVLHALSGVHGWKLIIAHLNHGLRGRAAGADARFVKLAASRLGLRCVVERADVKQYARERKLSQEMAARSLRHAFLARTARRLRAHRVVLAHHADDQVELFFLRLLRGAGSDGLAGMRTHSASPVNPTVTLIRPLLGIPKDALEEFARRRRIAYREDATNRSLDIPRNQVRHELLPLLHQEYQSSLAPVILRTMELLRAEAEFVVAEAELWLKSAKRQPFARLAVALQRRIVQKQLHHAGLNVDFQWIEQLRLNADEWKAPRAGFFCRLRFDGKVETKAAEQSSFQTEQETIRLRGASRTVAFATRQFSWAFRRGPRPRPQEGTEFFDAVAVGDAIILRHWRAGDRFQPIGMAHPVKLQDLFVNQKIPRTRRYGLVIATTEGGQIFWVEGLRMGEQFKITPATRRILQWNWRTE